MIDDECWAVVEHIVFDGNSDDECCYDRGISVHHESYRGKDSKEKAEARAKLLQTTGLNVIAEIVLPIRKSLPYLEITRRNKI
jgi:hypothetical protein